MKSSSNENSSEGESSSSKGMDEALRQLEELLASSSGSDDTLQKKRQTDEVFAKAMDSLGLKDVSPPSLEDEAKLFKDLAKEASEKSEDDVYAEVLSDIGGASKGLGTKQQQQQQLEQQQSMAFPDFDPKRQDTDILLNKALEEALVEAEEKSGTEIDKKSLLNDREIMKEIEKIFDRANDKLLQGLQEIRSEQVRV